MGIFDFTKKNNDVSIMIEIFHDLNKQMGPPIDHLEQNEIEVDYLAYLVFSMTYVIQLYSFSMSTIKKQPFEITSDNVTNFIEEIEKDINKSASNVSESDRLGTIFFIKEMAEDIINVVGDDYDMIFGTGMIDDKYLRPLTSKLLFRLTTVEGLDYLKDYVTDTLKRFTYCYLNAWC